MESIKSNDSQSLDVVDSDGPANFALIMLKEEKELLSFRKILDQSARYCNTRYEINSWPVDDAKTSWLVPFI